MCMGGLRWRGCLRRGRWLVRECMGLIGWLVIRCWRGWVFGAAGRVEAMAGQLVVGGGELVVSAGVPHEAACDRGGSYGALDCGVAGFRMWRGGRVVAWDRAGFGANSAWGLEALAVTMQRGLFRRGVEARNLRGGVDWRRRRWGGEESRGAHYRVDFTERSSVGASDGRVS